MPQKKEKRPPQHVKPLVDFVTWFSNTMSDVMVTVMGVLFIMMLILALNAIQWGVLVGLLIFFGKLTAPRPGERGRPRKTPLKTFVVLGSGGHTTEMMYTLNQFHWDSFAPTYLIADTDTGSERRVRIFEKKWRHEWDVERIPRAREVGQNYFSSIYTTLRGFYQAVRLVFKLRPRLVLCNGPGTCVPVVLAAYLLRPVIRVKVMYSESFTCVDHLSLSGKILYRMSDVFGVQWPQLCNSYPRALYTGRIDFKHLDDLRSLKEEEKQKHKSDESDENQNEDKMETPSKRVGNEKPIKQDQHQEEEDEVRIEDVTEEEARAEQAATEKKTETTTTTTSSSTTSSSSSEGPYVLVTVGSTKFEELIQAVDTSAFVNSVKKLGFKTIKIQIGSGEYRPHNLLKHGGVGFKVTIFEYDVDLPKIISRAGLVIGHAGAGTILDALSAGVKIVVVPNENLMANHQVQLAKKLTELGFAHFFPVGELGSGLQNVDFGRILPFPPTENKTLFTAVENLVGPYTS